jgi:uncharacterized protein YegJ (DUF2314 family)
MKILVGTLLLSISTLIGASLYPQQPVQRPADKPVPAASSENSRKLDQAIAPYVKKAKATLPQAKEEFLNGLAKGDEFFVTTRIYNPDGKYEQVFLSVTSWTGQTIRGVLATNSSLIPIKRGDAVICKERDVLDWTISKADGTEEGNFVGKFLDNYKP